jgi:hypothetical protein
MPGPAWHSGRMARLSGKYRIGSIPVAILAVIMLGGFGPRAAVRNAGGDGLRRGQCSLVIDGRRYISGRCAYSILQRGSFVISGPARRDYFAYVMMGDGCAEGFWSGERGATHASVPLGNLTRSGACWVNAHARICLRK